MTQPGYDPTRLPADLPAPEDDGAADHLPGAAVPGLALPASDGGSVDLAALPGRSIVFCYPRTGRPDEAPLTPDWDAIPGARGCTPQVCDLRDHLGELQAAGADHVVGVSTQTTADQQEAAQRLRLQYPLLSDADLALAGELRLPTFEAGGRTLLRRLTLVVDDGRVSQVFYPVFPPDSHSSEVLAWLHSNPR